MGLTEVDNGVMSYFPRMLKLKYLDLDQAEVTGTAFAEGCEEFYRRNGGYPPLEYLNIEQERMSKSSEEARWNFGINEMKIIGSYLANLKYIEISTFLLI